MELYQRKPEKKQFRDSRPREFIPESVLDFGRNDASLKTKKLTHIEVYEDKIKENRKFHKVWEDGQKFHKVDPNTPAYEDPKVAQQRDQVSTQHAEKQRKIQQAQNRLEKNQTQKDAFENVYDQKNNYKMMKDSATYNQRRFDMYSKGNSEYNIVTGDQNKNLFQLNKLATINKGTSDNNKFY